MRYSEELLTLHRLIYISQASQCVNDNITDVLRDVLLVAAQRNEAASITGALLYCDGWFLQVLEGARLQVGMAYGRICNDRRHRAVEVIEAKPVEKRVFQLWSMCGAQLSPMDTAIVETLERGESFQPRRLNGATALKLLGAVRKLQLRGIQ